MARNNLSAYGQEKPFVHFSFPCVYTDKSWSEYYFEFQTAGLAFWIAEMGHNIILYIGLRLISLPGVLPVKADTHKQTYKHKLNPLSLPSRPQIALSIIFPWKSLLLQQHTSFLGRAFCHFTAAIHLPSPRQGAGPHLHRYIQQLSEFLETVVLDEITSALMYMANLHSFLIFVSQRNCKKNVFLLSSNPNSISS